MFTIHAVGLDLDDARLRAAGGIVVQRPVDRSGSELRTRVRHVVQAVRTLWFARRARCLVVANSMIEALVVAALRWLLAPRLKIVLYDFLLPDLDGRVGTPARLLRRYDRVVCIRTADMTTLARKAGVAAERLTFVEWPANPRLLDVEPADDGYVYSGGNTQRDWPTVVAALGRVDGPVRAVLSTTRPVDVPPALRDRIELPGPVPPDAGRELVRRASVVVAAHFDTDLAHGPLVLMDAMALGKAVVTTATAGTVDYVRDGTSGIVVPPGDVDALARAIERLLADPGLRARLGQGARDECRARFSPARVTERLLAVVDEVTAA